jgi:hypothetical protein
MSGEASLFALSGGDWDPNILFNQPPHECRIYGDDNAQTWSVVSPEDYQACVAYRWRYKASSSGGHRKTKKRYLARNVHVNHGNGGAARDNRTQENEFLHAFIMKRMGKPRPSAKHIIDHRDGDEDNCRRKNLRWVTPSFNTKNRNGSHAGEEHDDAASQ